MSLTQAELKELLHYSPDSGVFTRLVSAGGVKVGDVAGGVNGQGYICIRVKGKKHLAQRLAFLYMTGEFPKDQMDHINHIRDDNRWNNLREVTNQENCVNRSKRKDNTSGVAGVSWHKNTEKWQAEIVIDGKRKHLGYYDDKFDAIYARKAAENKYGYHPNHGA